MWPASTQLWGTCRPPLYQQLRRRASASWQSAGWLFLASGALASAGGNWFSVWLLARSAPQDLLGAYALALSWVLPLFTLCSMQLRPLQATESKPEATADAYRLLRLAGLGIALSVVLVAAQFLKEGSPLRWLFLLVALPRVAEILSDYTYGVRTRRAAFREIGASQIARATLSVTAFALCWLAWSSLFNALLAAGVIALFVSVLMDGREFWDGSQPGLRSLRRLHAPKARRAAQHLLVLAAPLTLVAFLNASVVNLPRILLGRAGLLHEVAVLACLMSLLVVPGLLAAAYSASLSPRFARAFTEGGIPLLVHQLRVPGMRVLAAALSVALLLLLAGKPVMRVVFGDVYAVDTVTLTAAALFTVCWSLSAVLGTATTAARRLRPQLIAFTLASACCLGLGWWLVPSTALPGALWSLAIAATLLLCVYLGDLYLAHRRTSRRVDFRESQHSPGEPPLLSGSTERSARMFAEHNRTQSPVGSIGPRPNTLRVLHVTSSLNAGGVETWLLRLARLQTRPALSTDAAPDNASTGNPFIGSPLVSAILVLGEIDGDLAPEFRRLHVPVFRLPSQRGLAHLRAMCRFFRETGPWDVVHSHVFRHSLLVQLAALSCRVPLRITHGHHCSSDGAGSTRALRKLLCKAVGWLLRQLSHQAIACSSAAASSLFGPGAGRRYSFLSLPCGIDEHCFAPCIPVRETGALRTREGIPADALVLGHVGRFVEEKGHERLLRAAALALVSQPNLYFLLIGDGPLRPAMEGLALSLGIHQRVQFAGNRQDVPRLLQSAMDGFLFPSLREGLGVAVVEAQAAGLPCLLSSAIPPEANLFPAHNSQFPHDADVPMLSVALLQFARSLRQRTQHGSLMAPLRLPAPYRLDHNAHVLASLYQSAHRVPQPCPEVHRREQPA